MLKRIGLFAVFGTLTLALVVLILGLNAPDVQTISKKAGIGDTLDSIDSEWNQGYRQDNTDSVSIGKSKSSCIQCSIGLLGHNFGDPLRIGRIDANANGLFGVDDGTIPTTMQFFSGILDLMPKDTTCISAWTSSASQEKTGLRKDVYHLHSINLSHLPNIQSSSAYAQYTGANPGDFLLIVNYSLGDTSHVANFLLALGIPGDIDVDGLKKITKNIPFPIMQK